MKKRIFLLSIIASFLLVFSSCSSDKNGATLEANKEILKKLYAAFESSDTSALSSLIADDFKTHTPDPSIPGDGKAHWIMQAMTYGPVFPDMKSDVKVTLAEGDLVACFAAMTGTNTGPMGPMPATGKSVNVNGVDIIRVKDGKVVEHWGIMDMMTMMTQLGLVPDMDAGDNNMAPAADNASGDGADASASENPAARKTPAKTEIKEEENKNARKQPGTN